MLVCVNLKCKVQLGSKQQVKYKYWMHVSLAKVSYEFAHYIHLWIGNARIIN